MRDRLAQHRQAEACAACHARIDPFGFALEAYDPIGRLRTHEWEVKEDPPGGKGLPKRHALRGAMVETGATLADGRSFADLAGLKALLIHDADRFKAALAAKLITFMLGRASGFADRPWIDRVIIRLASTSQGGSLPGLIIALISSDEFRQRAGHAPGPTTTSIPSTTIP